MNLPRCSILAASVVRRWTTRQTMAIVFHGMMFRVLVICGLVSPVGCIRFHRKGELDVIRAGHQTSAQQRVHRRSEATMTKAIAAYQAGDVTSAMSLFQQAIDLDPTNGRAHNNLGLIFYEQHQLALAASHFDAASEFLPEDATPVNNLGMTLEAGGRMDEAIELYRRASVMNPSNPLYLGNLVKAKLRMGEQDDLLYAQMQSLLMIETRPHWIGWIRDQLNLDLNPLLDRGGDSELTLASGESSDTPDSQIEQLDGPVLSEADPSLPYEGSQIELPPPVVIEDPRQMIAPEIETLPPSVLMPENPVIPPAVITPQDGVNW
ncbi:MAG: tetratricopeptide repeat protein [Planctomycetota bacterium]